MGRKTAEKKTSVQCASLLLCMWILPLFFCVTFKQQFAPPPPPWPPDSSPSPRLFYSPAPAAAVLLLQGPANVLENQRQPQKEGISCAYWSCWKWLKGDLCRGWGGSAITAFDLSLSVCYEKEGGPCCCRKKITNSRCNRAPAESLPRRKLKPV